MKTTHFTHLGFEEATVKADAVVLCDIHCPFQDEEMLRLAVNKGAEYGVTHAILNELYNQDEFSNFKDKDPKGRWALEIESVHRTMEILAQQFTHFTIIDTNHGARLKKKTDGGLRIQDIAHMTIPLDLPISVITTDNEFCFLQRTWMVTHSEEYSKKPGKKPYDIGLIYGKNVIQAHSHMLNHMMVHSDEGVMHYIDGGCCLDKSKVRYATSKVTTHGKWTQGFVIIKDEEPIIIAKAPPVSTSGKVVLQW